MTHRIAAGVARGRRFRAWTACATILAFAWYALSPLPWVLLSAARTVGAAVHAVVAAGLHRSHENDHDHDHPHPSHGIVAADIPGSPTHPQDHDCFECEVLKCLARCMLPGPVAPTVVALGAASVKPSAFPATRHAIFAAPHPPIRGPPLAGA